MPVAAGGGGLKPGKKKDPIVKGPVGGTPAVTSTPAASPSSPGSSSGSKGGGVLGASRGSGSGASSSSSSSSSSSNPYLAQQRKSQRAAQSRYIEDAERLGGQIAALRAALGKDGAFRQALMGRLGNVDSVLAEQIDAAKVGFNERWDNLAADQQNNEAAAGDASTQNEGNRSRERTMALSEAAAQGAGESDQLATQLMSLRNWEANQAEVSRSYADSARSITSSRIDLVADTRTAMQNMALEADADKQQLWDDYWAQKSETQIALGNALGQQAEYLGLAKEQGAKSVSKSLLSGGAKGGGKGRGHVVLNQWAGGGPERPYDIEDSGPDRGGLGMMHQRTTSGGGQGLATRGTGKNKTKQQGGKGNKSIDKQMSTLEQQSDAAFMAGTRAMGQNYDAKGVPEWLKGWGPDIPEPARLSSSLLQNARTTVAQKRPEGATLRKW